MMLLIMQSSVYLLKVHENMTQIDYIYQILIMRILKR